MATRQAPIRQDDFSAGAFADIAAYLIPDSGVKSLTDAFVEEDGSATERGGTVYKSGAAFGSSLRWIHDAYFDVGQRTVLANTSDFGVLASDDSTVINLGSDGLSTPMPSALVAGMLFIGGGYIYAGSRMAANYSTGTVTLTNGSTTVTGAGTTWNTLTDAGMLLQRGNERNYVVASIESTTSLTLAEPYEGVTGAGVAYTLRPIYKITTADPYPSATFYWTTMNRLMYGAGNLVHASEQLRPHDFTATFGVDEVPTIHELPEGVRVTGGATVGQTSFVFTTHGVWTIDGLAFDIAGSDGAPQHRLQRHSEHILWDANGITSWEQGLIVPCVDGIYLLGGITPAARLSHPSDETVMSYVDRGFRCGQSAVYRGHYILPVYSGTVTMRDQLVCRVSRPIRLGGQIVYPWSHFDRHAADIVAFALRVSDSTAREPVLLGVSSAADARIVECPFFDPSDSVKTDANGEVQTLDLVSRQYPTGNDTLNMVRNARTRYELVGDGTAEVEFSYSLGGQISSGALWDQVDWDEFNWGEDVGEAAFVAACTGPESDGREPKRCRINESARFFQWRIRNPDPSASCRIRGIDIRVRPSGAVRR